MTFFGPDLRNGLPIGLGSVAGFGSARPFSPLSLFAGGINGAWYDPSDATTLFSDRAGTTPCATPGAGAVVPVGLMLDKSQGLVLGSELVTNGDFSSGTTGWTVFASNTLSVVSGAGKCVSSIADGAYCGYGISVVAGTLYKFTYTAISDGTSKAVGALLGASVGAASYLNEVATGGYAFGTRTFYWRATVTGTVFPWFYAGPAAGVGNYILIDDLTVKALSGNHAIAANDTTARPELSARVNLLLNTDTLSTQSVTTQATSYTLRFTGTGSIALSGTGSGTYSAGSNSVTCTAGTLTLTVSGTVTNADLRPTNIGSQIPAYQRVVDANTYDSAGFPRRLVGNGVSTLMTHTFGINANVTLMAAARRASGTGEQGLFGVTPPSTRLVGLLSANAVDPNWGTYAGGTFQSSGQSILQTNAVITNVAEPSLPSQKLYTNQSLSATITGALYAGDVNERRVIFADYVTLRLFAGDVYGIIAVAKTLTDGERTSAVTWLGGKMGQSI